MTDCTFKHYDLDLANLQNTTDSLNIINLSSEMHFSRDILNLTVTVFSLQRLLASRYSDTYQADETGFDEKESDPEWQSCNFLSR